MVDIAFVNKAYVFNSTSGNSTVVPVPSGTAAGQRMLAMVGSVASSPTITDPTGSTWVKMGEFAPGSTLKTALYYRDVTATAEPASYTWGWSGNGRNWGYMVAYANADLTTAPTFDQVVANDAAAGAGIASPSLGLSAGDWLVTLMGGRENPGTDTAKGWTNADTSDAERLNFYSSNTGTAAKTTAAWWDSARNLASGAVQRTITPSVLMQQVHLWSVRLAAQAPPSSGGGESTSWSRMGLPRA